MSRRPPPNLGDVGCGGGGRITRIKALGSPKQRCVEGVFIGEKKNPTLGMMIGNNLQLRCVSYWERRCVHGTREFCRFCDILSRLHSCKVGYLEPKKLCLSFLRFPRVECRSRDCPSHCNVKSVLRANLHPNKEGEHDPN